jgi:hypothetical protein
MSIRELWYRFLAAMARSDGNAPGLTEEPPVPRDLEPHVHAKTAHEESHTWKTHGGDRH